MNIIRQWAWAALVLPALQATQAQERGMTSNFYYARPGDLTITVNVVGFVQRPGRYEIASTIDLVNLLSLAGGPTADGTLGDVTITRLLMNGDQPLRRQVHVDLEDLEGVRAEDLLLTPGDMIAVGRSSWSWIRDAVGVVGYVAVLTTAVVQIISLSQ